MPFHSKAPPSRLGFAYPTLPYWLTLALGGAPKLENLQKVKTLEHLTFLAELGEKQVMADIVALSNALHRDK